MCTFAINRKYLTFMTCFTNYFHIFYVWRIGKRNSVHFVHIMGILQLPKLAKSVELWINLLTPVLRKKCCLNVRTSVWMWIQILFQWLRSLLSLRWTGLYIVLNLGSKTNSKLARFSIFIEFGSRLPPPPPLQCRRVAFAIDAILYEEQTMKTDEQCKHYNKVFAMLVIEKWLQVVQKRV